MAAEDPHISDHNRIGPMYHLSSAACEWFLILFLFLHASLSHLLSVFSKYCRLEIPCILFSRLDDKNPGHFSRRDSFKSLRDKLKGKLTNHPTASPDMLSRVGYSELKTESEFPFSDDEDDNRSSIGNKPSLPDLSEDGNGNENENENDLSVDVVFEMMEPWEKTSLMSELMSLGDDQHLFDFDGDSNVLLPRMQALSVLSEFLSLCNVPSSPDGGDITMKNIAGTSENEDTPMSKNTIETSSEDACS